MLTLNLLLGFVLNLIVAFLIVRFIYYPVKQNKNYVFTFIVFNSIIFLVMALLSSVELSIGVGFGLFAIFSVLQYRTTTIPTREMTYLFILIALAIINSTLMNHSKWPIVALANSAIPLLLACLEKGWGFHYELSKRILYDRIELIHPQNYPQLLADLQARTGLVINRIEVGNLDFLKDSASIRIYYNESDQRGWQHEEEVGDSED